MPNPRKYRTKSIQKNQFNIEKCWKINTENQYHIEKNNIKNQ